MTNRYRWWRKLTIPTIRGPLRDRFVWLGIAVALWVALVHGVTPWLIRLAYEGQAPFGLNRLISGQSVHPLERYLSVWNGLAWKLHLTALVGVALTFPGGRPRKAASRWLRAGPSLGARQLLISGLFWGLATGIAEGLHVVVRKAVAPINGATFFQSREAVWLVPIAEVPVFLAIAVALVLIGRAWRKPVSLRFVTVLLTFVGMYAVIRSARLGIGVWPVRLLALGIAVQAGIWLARRGEAFKRRLPALVAFATAWVLATALLLHGGRAIRERLATIRLPEVADGAPNVVLLILDTVRATSLSLYGHERPTTPRLDALAREGVVFDRAISVTSWTLPAHAAMLTGHYPWELSVGLMEPLDNARPTVAEVLASRGYATGGFVANRIYAGRDAGISRGFAHFEEEGLSAGWAIKNSWLARNVFEFARRHLSLEDIGLSMDAETVSDRFLRWAAERTDRPFLAMLNYMDAHAPYQAPDSVLSRFIDGRPRNEPISGTVYTEAELNEFRSAYEAAIAYIDQEIGRIVDTLEARGQLDHTVLIVTSDHGEHIGERDPGLHAHGNSLYGSTIEVPLLIRYPRALPAGLRVPQSVGTRRIAATIDDLTDTGASSPCPGPSLVAEIDAGQVGDQTPILSFLRPGFMTFQHEPLAAGPMVSVVLDRWHYIRNGDGAEELYDLEADPWELRDLAGSSEGSEVLERLRPEARPLEAFGVPAAARRNHADRR